MTNFQTINVVITDLTRMRHPKICIAGINADIINDLFSGKCHKKSNSIAIRPLLIKDEWNLDNGGGFKLYKMFTFTGYFDTDDNSKEDFIVTSYSEMENTFDELKLWDKKFEEIIAKHKEHIDCLGSDGFNELIVSTLDKENKSTKASTMELGPTLGIYKTKILKNFYLRRTQWRASWTFLVWGEKGEYILDLPITDIRFYDEKNNFSPKELKTIGLPFNSEMEILNSYVSVGFSREFKGQRWLQINSIHNPNEKTHEGEFLCPLCNSEVRDYRGSNTSTNYPNFKCTSKVCDQGNGYPWSSWDEVFPESDINENEAPF